MQAPRKVWLDTETYSEVPIKDGTHRYGENAEVMIIAYAFDDDPIKVVDLTVVPPDMWQEAVPHELWAALKNPAVEVWAHNSPFDRTVLRHNGAPIAVERWHDTMVQGYAHGMPGALGKLCEILGVGGEEAKDKRGGQLIRLFCVPQKQGKIRRCTRKTHPKEWQEFLDYAGKDITAMRAIHKAMPTWNFNTDKPNIGASERDLWLLDQKMNDRGFLVDMQLVDACLRAVDQAQSRLAARTVEITEGDVSSATKRDALLKHILEYYGVTLPDMQASTLKARIDDPQLPWAVKELLEIRLQASTSSTSKFKRLKASVSKDNRLRGTIQFCGAMRTGRDAGRYFQPQNLPRPKLKQKEIEFGIEALLVGAEDILYDNVMELTSAVIRSVIIAPEGKKLCVSDLANIEGRVIAWLADEKWKLQAFRDYDTFIKNEAGELVRKGHDLYKLAYSQAFGIQVSLIDDGMRQVGKVMELALGYEGGVGAFITFALVYGIDLDEMARKALPNIPKSVLADALDTWEWAVKNKRTLGLERDTYVVCDSFKRLWRAAHSNVARLWKDLDAAVKKAIEQKGVEFQVSHLRIVRQGNWLRIILPSGRSLCYPSPALKDGKISYLGVNQYTRKWERIFTYGGKLFENVCQAIARDVMFNALPVLEARGYDLLLRVHDELITEAPDTDEYSHTELSRILSTNPDWAEGLPLAAAGFSGKRYRKG